VYLENVRRRRRRRRHPHIDAMYLSTTCVHTGCALSSASSAEHCSPIDARTLVGPSVRPSVRICRWGARAPSRGKGKERKSSLRLASINTAVSTQPTGDVPSAHVSGVLSVLVGGSVSCVWTWDVGRGGGGARFRSVRSAAAAGGMRESIAVGHR